MKLSPSSSSERLSAIDIFRGLAVFGIFLVNILYMSTTSVFYERNGVVPEGETELDGSLKHMIELIFSGKMYPVLAFLFGVGFYFLMSRAERKGIRVRRFFLKRMSILFLIGAAHMILFYGGDILRTYAILGCLLLLFYRRRDKTILTWAVSILVLFLLSFSLSFLTPASDLDESYEANYAIAEREAAEAAEAYQSGHYGKWMSFHIEEEVLPALAMEQITYPGVFGMMLLGFYCGRVDLFSRVKELAPRLRAIRDITGSASVLITGLLALIRFGNWETGAYEAAVTQWLIYGCGIIVSLFYMTALLLALQLPSVQKLLGPFRLVGRMTLTNYLLQSAISIAVFAGFGLFGTLAVWQVLAYCSIVIALEILFSVWWMSRFAYGPAEWLWRRWTYGKLDNDKAAAAASKEVNA